jgi:hypothetical protein
LKYSEENGKSELETNRLVNFNRLGNIDSLQDLEQDSSSLVCFGEQGIEGREREREKYIVVIVIDCNPSRSVRVHIGSRGGMQAIRTGTSLHP